MTFGPEGVEVLAPALALKDDIQGPVHRHGALETGRALAAALIGQPKDTSRRTPALCLPWYRSPSAQSAGNQPKGGRPITVSHHHRWIGFPSKAGESDDLLAWLFIR
jgi:hypothetical protein